MSQFKKAERSQTKLRLALIGPSGAGKTLSALKIAYGIAGPQAKIAVVDTENGSASYYAGTPPKGYAFDIAQMNPPYKIEKYLTAIREAEEAGYDVIIVDSLSHAWAGDGGLLQQKESMDARGGNSFTNWGRLTPTQNQLVSAVLHSKTNIICTMRSKMAYSVQENEKGKAVPKKVGLAPVQREGFEYEFDIVFDVDLDTHTATASKDRTGIFADHDPFRVEEKHGKLIANWQASGKPLTEEKVDPPPPAKTPPPPLSSRYAAHQESKESTATDEPPLEYGEHVVNLEDQKIQKIKEYTRIELELMTHDLRAKKNNPTAAEVSFVKNAEAYLVKLKQKGT